MRLSLKVLKNLGNVNLFQYADQAYVSEGQANSFYIQLVDLDVLLNPKDSEAFPSHPLRYIPASGATLSVEFDSIDDEEKFTVNATQPFSADDRSIFLVSLTDEQIPKSGNFTIVLTEGANVRKSVIKQGISTQLLDVGSC